jgi:hypothetical protein
MHFFAVSARSAVIGSPFRPGLTGASLAVSIVSLIIL